MRIVGEDRNAVVAACRRVGGAAIEPMGSQSSSAASSELSDTRTRGLDSTHDHRPRRLDLESLIVGRWRGA
jgi:hypothetical protein